MNLTILLLTARHWVTKEQIRAATEPYYTASDEAFEKMFERDKEELRASGVPIEVGSVDAYFEDEVGYRIQRSAFELPEIQLSQEEADVLGLAVRHWQQTGLSAETTLAIAKLRAAGVEIQRDTLSEMTPSEASVEAAFTPVWKATMARQEIRFGYLKPGDGEPVVRRLQPYRVTTSQDRWYVVGQDLDRGEPRMFRLSRIVGDVTAQGKEGAYDVPATVDLDALTDALRPAATRGEAVLMIREGQAHGLRRRGRVLEPASADPSPSGWDRVGVPYADVDKFAGELRAAGPAVVVESPAEVREAVVAALKHFEVSA